MGCLFNRLIRFFGKGGLSVKKQLPNIISSSRILCAIFLFFLTEISVLFISVYFYCGLSDLVDGKLARKLDAISLLGTKLDTAGDVITYLALAKILYIQSLIPVWVIVWLVVAMVGFIASAVISKIRLGKFYFVHSLFGKILGTAAFIIPFVINFVKSNIYLGVVCGIASIAAIESIIIQSKSKEIKTDAVYIGKSNS